MVSPYDFMQNEVQCIRGVSNTHAQNTIPLESDIKDNSSSDLEALLDWLSITFDTDFYNVEFVLDLLYMYFDLPYFESLKQIENDQTDWITNQYYEKGYKKSISFGNIIIFYGSYGKVAKGIKLSISGQGMRQAELLFRKDYNWFDFLKKVSDYHVNFTRIDLALDDHRGYFSIQQLIDYADSGRLVSKFKKYRKLSENLTATGESLGSTLYVGNPKSRLYFRFYEKAKQLELDKSITWNRTELQLKNERAQAFVDWFILNDDKHIGEFIIGVLNQYIKFCALDQTDSNRSRWDLAIWWQEFLTDSESIRLTTKAPDNDIKTKEMWLEKQVSKTLATIFLAYQDHPTKSKKIESLIYKGVLNLDDRDKKLITRFKEQIKKADCKKSQSTSENTIIIEPDKYLE